MPLILDTLVGGAVQKIGAVKLTGSGSSVITAGEAAGVLKPNGTRHLAARGGDRGRRGRPPSLSGGSASRTTEEFLSNVDGATLVRADDFGNVYELPNVGGVPEITLDAKAGILGELESEYATTTGKNIKLVEVLKPSSPMRKPGGVAKLELTEQKTGKPEMIDAGAPESSSARPTCGATPPTRASSPAGRSCPRRARTRRCRSGRRPTTAGRPGRTPSRGRRRPGCRSASARRPGSRSTRSPTRPASNASSPPSSRSSRSSQGTAEAKLIRVKKYVVEVVDTKSGKVVNTKTVVDEPVAAPQTADADAVAVAKQKLDTNGNPVFDSQGRPVVEPLSRSEREFVMQRYIDKNIKARRSGLMPDAAEHGVTLVMDDASAKAAGKLLPMYGAPFLSEGVGSAYLQRIAKFVKPKGVSSDEMYRRMLQARPVRGRLRPARRRGHHRQPLPRGARRLVLVIVASGTPLGQLD